MNERFNNSIGQHLDVREFSLPSYFANDMTSDFSITQLVPGDPAFHWPHIRHVGCFRLNDGFGGQRGPKTGITGSARHGVDYAISCAPAPQARLTVVACTYLGLCSHSWT